MDDATPQRMPEGRTYLYSGYTLDVAALTKACDSVRLYMEPSHSTRDAWREFTNEAARALYRDGKQVMPVKHAWQILVNYVCTHEKISGSRGDLYKRQAQDGFAEHFLHAMGIAEDSAIAKTAKDAEGLYVSRRRPKPQDFEQGIAQVMPEEQRDSVAWAEPEERDGPQVALSGGNRVPTAYDLKNPYIDTAAMNIELHKCRDSVSWTGLTNMLASHSRDPNQRSWENIVQLVEENAAAKGITITALQREGLLQQYPVDGVAAVITSALGLRADGLTALMLEETEQSVVSRDLLGGNELQMSARSIAAASNGPARGMDVIPKHGNMAIDGQADAEGIVKEVLGRRHPRQDAKNPYAMLMERAAEIRRSNAGGWVSDLYKNEQWER